MGILSWLFGNSAESEASEASREYKEFLILATPIKEGNQYRISGKISKGDNEKQFIRSDLIADKVQAEQISLDKGVTIIDQRGDGLFQLDNI